MSNGTDIFQNLMATDIDFFESELVRFKEQLQEGSIIDRRAKENNIKEDPYEELSEVIIDAQHMENEFLKTLDMSMAMVKHAREKEEYQAQVELELDILRKQHQEAISLHQSNLDDKESGNRLNEAQAKIYQDHELQIKKLNDRLQSKGEVVQKLNGKIHELNR